MQTKVKYFMLALIVLIADQVSKAWATEKLLPVDTLEVIPNLPREDVPVGTDEKGNKEVRKVGVPPKLS